MMQFTQGLHRSVQQHPQMIATVCGGRRQTFQQLAERVSRLAGGLASVGISKGDRVAILSLNSDHYLECYLAIAWLGAVVNPANFRWSNAEVVYSLNDSESSVLIVDAHFADQAEEIQRGASCVKHLLYIGDGDTPEGMIGAESLIRDNPPIADTEAGNDDLFGIFYTGGTTGAPKGVMLSHRNIFSSALALLAEGLLPEGAIGMHNAPMFHLADMMLTTGLLIRGGSHVFLPAFRPDDALAIIEQEGVTDLLLVPAMLQVLIDLPNFNTFNVSSIKRIMYGASPASESLLDRAMAALPITEFTQVYGMTETSAVMTVLPAVMHTQGNRHLGRVRSGGRSACHVQIRIVDPKGHPLDTGSVGEIIARGPNVMQGYLNKPEATTEALAGGWMHTGDIGYMDNNGYVFIVDRSKDMIISGGENVYSTEVENAISSHPAVASCAVIGIPCNEMGEKVHAVLVLKAGADISQDTIYRHCKDLIAGYKCPRSMEVVDALPLSGAGKILKTELRKPYWQNKDKAVN